jgi:hypothetical protein
MRQRPLGGSLTLVLGMMICWSAIGHVTRNDTHFNEYAFGGPYLGATFNRDAWKAYHPQKGQRNPRVPMLNDLVRNKLRKRMEKHEIAFLLGAPDKKESSGNTETWYYDIGKERGVSQWLGVHFDREHKADAVSLDEKRK